MTRLSHHRCDEIVHIHLVFDREQLVLETLFIAKSRRLVDCRWKRENLSDEIDALPMNKLTGAIRDLRENICEAEGEKLK